MRQARERIQQLEAATREPIAITGMACRFPGAEDIDSFWQSLCEAADGVTTVPADRWDVATHHADERGVPGTMYTRAGGFLNRVDGFDPQFFGISPREARSIDPQHRLLLELAWESLEHAAVDWEALSGSNTGVFIGITTADYQRRLTPAGQFATIDAYYNSGSALNAAAGRIAYILGLRGPCVAVDTACSSSLVALHLACNSLRNRECDMALVGGVNLIVSPENSIAACQNGMMSPSGRCRTFSGAADGYIRGEGGAALVLRRRSDAVAQRERILVSVLGSAMNQNGASGGLTVPSAEAQREVMAAALSRAGLKPGDVQYVEAHGTGTQLGDPIEVRALGALHAGRGAPLLIGTAKSNIGHLEAAAGLAGLIKASLSLWHRKIPASLHSEPLSPHVDWASVPVRVVTELRPWPEVATARAGVSSLGG
ncbi:MAG: polyketide synthase, partial [Myxococcota bacterium]